MCMSDATQLTIGPRYQLLASVGVSGFPSLEQSRNFVWHLM
jgi:hypothetical protein